MKKKLILILLSLCFSNLFAQESDRFVDIVDLDVNSENADFGVTFYKNDMILFVSSRKDISGERKERSRNRMQNLEFYKGLIGDNGEIIFAGRYSMEKNNMFYESDITFTPDGKTIYFTLNNYANDEYFKNNFDKISRKKHILNIYKANIDDAGLATNLESLPINNDEFSVHHPRLSPDGKTLYYVANTDEGYGKNDIYKVEIKDDDTYGEPTNLGPEINTTGNEMFPFLSTNNILYFSSDGHGGSGYLDIFSSDFVDGIYNEAENVGGDISSPYDDFAFVISPEKGLGYFSSTRESVGDADIFSFRIKPMECNQIVAGVIKNKLDEEPIDEATVQLFSNEDLIATTYSDSNGFYSFDINCETSYSIYVYKEAHSEITKDFTTSNINESKVDYTLHIEPLECKQTIMGTVTSKETRIPLFNVELALYYNDELIEKTYSKIGGVFNFHTEVECNSNYSIISDAANYLPTFVDLKTTNVLDEMHSLKVEMEEFQDFVTIRNIKMIKTEPIYFDLNDSAIGEQATVELNKVVDVMRNQPNIKVEINSHTDSRAPDSYNLRLSDDRAKATIAYIISKGIDPDRISGQGYGETRLLNKCSNGVKCTESEHQKNRRTEFIIVNE